MAGMGKESRKHLTVTEILKESPASTLRLFSQLSVFCFVLVHDLFHPVHVRNKKLFMFIPMTKANKMEIRREIVRSWHCIPIMSRQGKLSYGRKRRLPGQKACRIMRECEVNQHHGRWEGRNFEVTSTTGQEAGKKRIILTKDRNASGHQRAGPTRRNLKELLISRVTG